MQTEGVCVLAGVAVAVDCWPCFFTARVQRSTLKTRSVPWCVCCGNLGSVSCVVENGHPLGAVSPVGLSDCSLAVREPCQGGEVWWEETRWSVARPVIEALDSGGWGSEFQTGRQPELLRFGEIMQWECVLPLLCLPTSFIRLSFLVLPGS